jgi:hypothetical protein
MTLGPYPAENPEPRPPVAVTALVGNNQNHTTSGLARKVAVYVHAPTSGPVSGRPTINGSTVRGSEAGRYEFVAPDGFTISPMTVATKAGNNDVVIVEEF